MLESDIFEVSSQQLQKWRNTGNTYRNINIGLANEMAIICNKMGINVWEVIEAAKTKPWLPGLYPGPRSWRSLHTAGSILPDMESQRI